MARGYSSPPTDEAANFRLVAAPVENPSKPAWTELLPHRPAVKVDSTDAFPRPSGSVRAGGGTRQIRVLPLAGGISHTLPRAGLHRAPTREPRVRHHPAPLLLYLDGHAQFGGDYDMAGRSWTVRKQTEVLGGYDPAEYRSERLFACAPDGEGCRSRWCTGCRFTPGERRPLLLNGYGAYGVSFDPASRPAVCRCSTGGSFVAIAHVARGRGDGGGRGTRAASYSESGTASLTSSPRRST